MTKRASGKFDRRRRDTYDTPAAAVLPLLEHLPPEFTFWEPCAGSGALVKTLEDSGHGVICSCASDIEPRAPGIVQMDVFNFTYPLPDLSATNYFITNPPWERTLLHRIIPHLSEMRPTWLLFDADWMHTKQAIPHLAACSKIVSVGRVSWMENGVSGFDNCAWYLFDARHIGATRFFGRIANG